MKRTRRAALAMIAGSSSLLAVETLGFSSGYATRNARADVVGDENAYLGLTEDGLEAGGVLFDEGIRTPPATFDVVNQLPVPIAICLESDAFRFGTAGDTAVVEGGRVLVGDGHADGSGDGTGDRLGPGERIPGITVDIDPSADVSTAGSTVTGTIEITAKGEDTLIEADRELTLENRGHTVERALLDLSRRRGSFEHRWLLEGVETAAPGLEWLRFDYTDVRTRTPIDFTEAESLSVAVVVDDTEYAGTIERRRPNRLAVALDRPVAVDGADVELVLSETGPPASPGGGIDRPSGATVELLGGGFSARVEGVWSRLSVDGHPAAVVTGIDSPKG